MTRPGASDRAGPFIQCPLATAGHLVRAPGQGHLLPPLPGDHLAFSQEELGLPASRPPRRRVMASCLPRPSREAAPTCPWWGGHTPHGAGETWPPQTPTPGPPAGAGPPPLHTSRAGRAPCPAQPTAVEPPPAHPARSPPAGHGPTHTPPNPRAGTHLLVLGVVRSEVGGGELPAQAEVRQAVQQAHPPGRRVADARHAEPSRAEPSLSPHLTSPHPDPPAMELLARLPPSFLPSSPAAPHGRHPPPSPPPSRRAARSLFVRREAPPPPRPAPPARSHWRRRRPPRPARRGPSGLPRTLGAPPGPGLRRLPGPAGSPCVLLGAPARPGRPAFGSTAGWCGNMVPGCADAGGRGWTSHSRHQRASP